MWTTPLWSPPQDLSPTEEKIAARAAKKKKLFVFLRAIRTEPFDPAFQEELAGMYRQTGAGKPPVPPALLAMATLLQTYTGVSDQEAVEWTLDSKRWQLVLDGLRAEEPLFSQGALFDFRMRLMSTGMDQRLWERTVELARARGGFNAKTLRLALDSSPLWGHGRVEDTFHLLGHAAHQVIACLAELTRHEIAHVIEPIGLSLFEAPSLKAALDIDWGDAAQQQQALQQLCDELDALQTGIGVHVPVECKQPPLAAALDKQVTGLERCQCRKARIQRHHIGCAFLVWVRLKELAVQTGRTVYQLKHGLLDDYLIHQLKNPSLKMRFA